MIIAGALYALAHVRPLLAPRQSGGRGAAIRARATARIQAELQRQSPVVRTGAEGLRVARAHRWGLVPHWAKDPAIGNKLANARGESLVERPAFRDAFRQWRCLVPASGFYEWQRRGGRKLPWYVRPRDAELFALAGITAFWQGLRTVSLITTEPNELMRPIHDRMPVIIAPEQYDALLDPAA